jgi:hypothetical protein
MVGCHDGDSLGDLTLAWSPVGRDINFTPKENVLSNLTKTASPFVQRRDEVAPAVVATLLDQGGEPEGFSPGGVPARRNGNLDVAGKARIGPGRDGHAADQSPHRIQPGKITL